MSHKRYYAKAGVLWLTNLHKRRFPTFSWQGKHLPYFNHRYNYTWMNERTVEIPLMRDVLTSAKGRVLEVGNVLGCYDPGLTHTVVDKYEKPQRANAFAEDAETFSTGTPFDLIISISTLEHVGWDESPRDEEKIGRTIRHLRNLLSPEGRFIFTAPVGYSPPLDRFVDAGDGFISRTGLRRVSARNEWVEAEWPEIRSMKFHHPYPFANGLVVATLGPLA